MAKRDDELNPHHRDFFRGTDFILDELSLRAAVQLDNYKRKKTTSTLSVNALSQLLSYASSIERKESTNIGTSQMLLNIVLDYFAIDRFKTKRFSREDLADGLSLIADELKSYKDADENHILYLIKVTCRISDIARTHKYSDYSPRFLAA